MNNDITRVPSEIGATTSTVKSGQNSAVLMLNLDHYTAGAGFPGGSKYKTYMAESAANMMGPMSPGRLVPKVRLVLGIRTEPGSAEMYQLQEL